MSYMLGAHGFVATKGIIPWIIRKLCDSRFNHTFVFLTDKLILEAKLFRGVHISHVSQYLYKPVLICKNPAPFSEEEMDLFVKDHLFDAYGFFQSIGFLWVLWFKRKHNPITDGTICAEANYLVATEVQKDKGLANLMDKNTANPGNISEYMKKTYLVLIDTDFLSNGELERGTSAIKN